MTPEIAAVEQALAVGFDQQRVGIVSGVIDQIRCDGERAERGGLAGLPVDQRAAFQLRAFEPIGGAIQDALPGKADADGQARVNSVHEADVILMRMGNQHGEQVVAAFAQAGDFRHEAVEIVGIGVQWQAKIKRDAARCGFSGDFDAGAADLAGTSVDADFHVDAVSPV